MKLSHDSLVCSANHTLQGEPQQTPTAEETMKTQVRCKIQAEECD